MAVREKLRFAAFELDLQAHELLRNGRPVRLAPQAERLLEFLATPRGSPHLTVGTFVGTLERNWGQIRESVSGSVNARNASKYAPQSE